MASGHYHCSVKGVGRGTGAGVMHKAAYRAGERLYDERAGEWTADYGKRARSVTGKFIMTRDAAAAWRGNRQRLWNAAEAAEARSNGRLATELELALPHELAAAQRKELLTGFLVSIVNRHGIAADVAIHTAHDDRNIHAHVLLTHRELGPDGFGEIANARTITKKVRGREKIIGIAGIAATPADITAIRKAWAGAVNRAYAMAGIDIRVDHRSHEERGIADVPTIHLGPKASAMERRQPGSSDRGDVNREIERHNAHRRKVRQLRAEGRRLTQRQAQAAAASRDFFLRPETARAFSAATARTAEPVAPSFDRAAAAHKPAREAVQTPETTAAPSAPGQAATHATEPQREAEPVFSPRSGEPENSCSKREPAAVAPKGTATGGAVTRLFREVVKAVTQRATGPPQPQPKRRRREETGGEFRKLARTIARRIDTGREFGKAAKKIMRRRTIKLPSEAYAAATFLWNTLDAMNPWHNNAASSGELDEGFHCTETNHLFPRL